MNSRFVRAQKQAVKARIIFTGTAGGGTFEAALNVALGLTQGKIAVLDTEHGMTNLHSGLGAFDVLDLTGPYTTDKFIAAVEAAEKEGYDVLIINTLSQAWAGEGGILEQVGKLTAAKGSKNGVWDTVQPLHDEMMNRIRRSSLHILVILQCKTEYLVPDQPGGVAPKKIGLTPVQKDGMDYGFHAGFYIEENSRVGTCSADHTGLFGGAFAEIMTKDHGAKLRAWADNSVVAKDAPKPSAKPEAPTSSGGATAMFINADQVANLKDLMKVTGADTAKFLAHFKADKLEKLPVTKYAEAVAMLEAKKGKGTQAGKPSAKLSEALRARNIPFEETQDGILATPAFTDNAAKQFLREQGFKWESKKKKWQLAA